MGIGAGGAMVFGMVALGPEVRQGVEFFEGYGQSAGLGALVGHDEFVGVVENHHGHGFYL